MTMQVSDSWIMRLRNPADFEKQSLTRFELLWFGSALSCLFQFFWVLALVYLPLDQPAFKLIVISSLLSAIPLLLALVCPASVFARLPVALWILLAREKGSLATYDMITAFLSVVGLVASFFRFYGHSAFLPSLLLFASIGLCAVLQLFILPSESFNQRKWQFTIPDWLKKSDDSHDDKSTEEVIPEEGSNAVFDLAIDDKTYKVGIKILDEIVNLLRKHNVDAKGYLYQKNPGAVILMAGEPVNGTGKDDVIRLCRQFVAIMDKHSLTRFQIANLLLFFVQKNFTYAYDIDSTKHIPGGPYVEYGRFALETLIDKVGDCECVSILTATLLAHMGFETALLYMDIIDPEDKKTSCHCAVGLKADQSLFSGAEFPGELDTFKTEDGSTRYLYGEATHSGQPMSFGFIPICWNSADVMPVESRIVVPVSLT